MKKLFSKIDNTSKEPNSYLGKVFVVGRHAVTVEEVLAEGTYIAHSVSLSLMSASVESVFGSSEKRPCH